MNLPELGPQINPHFFGLDKSYLFFGRVEDREDPLQLGRVRIRVFGIHPDDKTLVPTEDLPWAIPIVPITSALVGGVGTAPVGILPDSIVVGFFADGIDRQIPMFFGVISGGTGHFAAGGDGASGSNNTDLTNLPPAQTSGSVVQKGTQCAKNLLVAIPGLKPHHAAAITGNLAAESGLRAVREGSARVGPPWPRGTPGKGYGWAQWTNTSNGTGNLNSYLDFCSQNHLDPASDDANIKYLGVWLDGKTGDRGIAGYVNKMKANQTVTVKGYWAGTYDCSTVEGATAYWMAVAERPKKGLDHLNSRISYAKQILNNVQGGGKNGNLGGPITAQQKPQTGTKK
jgi:hypothetical protein